MKNILIGALTTISLMLMQGLQDANAQSWNLTGNAGTTSSNFIGTTDYVSLKIRTNNLVRMTVTNAGKVGIGTTSPAARLNVANTDLTGISTTGAFQIGASNTYNLVCDNNEIQARVNGLGSDLYLNYWEGAVKIGNAFSYTQVLSDIYMDKTLAVSGRLGIKTTTPNNDLDINSTDYTAAYITSPYNGGTVLTVVANGTTAGTWGLYSYATTAGYAGYFSGNVFCTATYSGSDEKLKENIQPFQNAIEKVMRVDVKSYNFKNEYAAMNFSKGNQIGFIAQNLETVFPELVKVNPAKKEQPVEFKAVNYTGMIPVLTKAIQEQQIQMEIKDKAINVLQNQLNEMKQCLESLCDNSSLKNSSSSVITESKLMQNQPNPFNQTTIIRYALSSEHSSGVIIIRDLTGNLVKSIAISNTGKGQATVNANEFTQGTYTYSLEIAGESVDTKLMVITK